MANEQDPMPKMQASQDDIDARQKQLQQRRLAAQRAAKARQAGVAQAAAAPAPAPKQTLAIVALVLAVAMGAFAGFLFMQLQAANQQLAKAESILNDHSANLAALNDKLSASDENANLSVDALKILLKDNAGEIRKLWDLSNKSNKPKIAKNTKSITSLNKKVAGAEKKAGTATSGVAANKQSIASLKSDLASKEKALEKKIAAAKAAAGLPAEVEQRIANNEDAILSLKAANEAANESIGPGDPRFEQTMKDAIEDINIRLDRMQNAMTGTL